MKYLKTPSQDILKQLLDYDPETGALYWRARPREFFQSEHGWKVWNAKHAGREAFTSSSAGYRQGLIFKKKYLAHRVIWKWMTGDEAPELDHENHVRSDNRWDNLRPVTRSQNNQNMSRRSDNTSGVTGIFWEKACSKWRVQIRLNGKRKHIGVYRNFEDAVRARKHAEVKHGFHPNHGKT